VITERGVEGKGGLLQVLGGMCWRDWRK